MEEIELPEDNYPKVLIGDVIEQLRRIPEDSVDTIVTSPPYWKQRDYGKDGQLGQEETSEEFIENMFEVAQELRRVLKDSGSYFLNIGDKYVDKDKQMIPFRLADKMRQEGDWAVRNVICWYKPNHMPSSIKDRFTNTWEPIFFFVKDDKDYYLAPRYNFNLDDVRVPHETDGNEIPSPEEVFTEEELEDLPADIVNSDTLPYTISPEDYEHLPKRLKKEGGTEYKGKFEDADKINRGQSPGARASVKGIYYSRQRKHDPDEESVIKYLRKQRNNSPYTTSEIDDELGYSHTAGHWFRLDEGGRSLPSPEDWVRLKDLLGFDDTFDKEMTETHYVLQGVRKHPNGKNPGDMWEMTTASLSQSHFAVFPEELPRRCIKATCPEDGIVLDPFAGSGTTGRVAQELGRKSIMIDINPEYKEIMEERFHGDPQQGNLKNFSRE